MSAADPQRAARASGIRGRALPSLEQVERRRFELWIVSTGLLVALTLALGVLRRSPVGRDRRRPGGRAPT